MVQRERQISSLQFVSRIGNILSFEKFIPTVTQKTSAADCFPKIPIAAGGFALRPALLKRRADLARIVIEAFIILARQASSVRRTTGQEVLNWNCRGAAAILKNALKKAFQPE